MQNKYLAIFTASILISSTVFAQLCPASNAPATGDPALPGIGDGCTTLGSQNVLPDIGIFRGTFTPSCNNHDKCLTTLGNTFKECNDRFFQDLRSACRSSYNPFWRPVEYTACVDTSTRYYAAVEANRMYSESIQGAYKDLDIYDAFKRSAEMRNKINANQCGTTPEATTIYSASLINRINSAFITYAGRKPTIYEFFDAVHLGGNLIMLTDETQWNNALNSYASSRRSVTPPSVNYTKTQDYKVTLNASSNMPSSFAWKANYNVSTDSAINFELKNPDYNTRWNIQGFVVAADKYNPSNRNMVLVNETIYEQGSCASSPGQACY